MSCSKRLAPGAVVGKDESLAGCFDVWLSDDPAATAIVDPDGKRWSRAALAQRAVAIADRLSATGVVSGDVVLTATDRTAETAACALAVSRLDAVFTSLPPGVGCDRAEPFARALGARLVVDCGGGGAVRAIDTPRIDHDGRCVLIASTSGSTGTPKFVMHGNEALAYVARACSAAAGLATGEAIFASIGPDSAAGYAFSIHFALTMGHPLVLADRWEPVDAMRRIVANQCRWTTMVPTQLLSMVEAVREGAWQQQLPLRAVAVGGSAMTAALIADADYLLGIPALRMFGMSECLAYCSVRLTDPEERHLSSDGRPFDETEIEAFDADGRALPRCRRGQAGVRGPSLFLGYAPGLGHGEEQFTPDGFLLTGDEIVRDEDGYVRVVGRLKDQIIRGGFNIDPAELEAILALHPSVAQVAVVAVPDPRLGERACAVVRLRPQAEMPGLGAFRALLADAGVYRRKWPEHVVAIGTMPRLPSGKVDRRAVAAFAAGAVVPPDQD